MNYKVYEGNKPYVFISYSHMDTDKVAPFVEALVKENCRVWYDGGIPGGAEWKKNIAAHVANCAVFVIFLSRNYMDSVHCQAELDKSIDDDIAKLPIHLDDVELDEGQKMYLSKVQIIDGSRKPEKAIQKLLNSPVISKCIEAKGTVTEQQETEKRDIEIGKYDWNALLKKAMKIAITVLLGIVLLLVILGKGCSFGPSSGSKQNETGQQVESPEQVKSEPGEHLEYLLYGEHHVKDTEAYISSNRRYRTLVIGEEAYEMSQLPVGIHGYEDNSVIVTFADRFGVEYSFKAEMELKYYENQGNTLILKAVYKDKVMPEGVYPLPEALGFVVDTYDDSLRIYADLNDNNPSVLKGTELEVPVLSGYRNDEQDVYKNIEAVSLKEGGTNWITFTDGGVAEVTVKSFYSNIGAVSLTWTQVTRPYNGRVETFDETGTVMIDYYRTEPDGFVIVSDGHYYRYQKPLP